MTKDHILVTGAAGFIGARTIACLHGRGETVIATDAVSPRVPPPDGVRFYRADIRDAARHAEALAQGCARIVHCGGVSGPMLLGDNPAELLDINIRGTTQLLALASAFGVRRVVALSSVSAYGSTPAGMEIVLESAPLSASTFYGTSKAAGDLVLQTYRNRGLVEAVALRVGWVYGPGRVTDALIQPIVRSATGEPYRVARGADHLLQFVHIDDLVSGIVAALDAPRLARPAYNINGAEQIRVGDMVEMIRARLPAIDTQIGPGLLDQTDVQGLMALDAAKDDLGWRPRVGFADGLAAYVDWLQENPF